MGTSSGPVEAESRHGGEELGPAECAGSTGNVSVGPDGDKGGNRISSVNNKLVSHDRESGAYVILILTGTCDVAASLLSLPRIRVIP